MLASSLALCIYWVQWSSSPRTQITALPDVSPLLNVMVIILASDTVSLTQPRSIKSVSQMHTFAFLSMDWALHFDFHFHASQDQLANTSVVINTPQISAIKSSFLTHTSCPHRLAGVFALHCPHFWVQAERSVTIWSGLAIEAMEKVL